jgi:predicted MFS family arabinose efflux permease
VTTGRERTRLFAWFNLSGGLTGGLGALGSIVPGVLATVGGVAAITAERCAFLLYAAAGGLAASVYRRLGSAARRVAAPGTRPLATSRRIVTRLAMLFSLDAFGGGFVVQSLLVLWLWRRFQLSPEVMGAVFFAVGILGALSQLASPWLAARIGLVPTMVWTHLPANAFLILAGVVPSATLAVTFLLLRALLSQMDVPARQAYVMAMVPPEERTAAASLTNVPRSLAAAIPPLLTGMMLDRSSFGWPLVCGGLLKALYDLLLLAQFRSVPADET